MKYRAGYKYQLAEDYARQTCVAPPHSISSEFISLDCDGVIGIKAGYAWDGPSGPTIDTSNFMRGSLVHDALYQLMRHGLLPQSFRAKVDLQLKRDILEDGMSRIRAWYVHRAVRRYSKPFALPAKKKRIYEAP